MHLEFYKKPKSPIVVEGFPGFGLVGTIVTEYLLDHLSCEKIGSAYFEDLPSTIAIHRGKVMDPVALYYNKKYNLVIVHSVAAVVGAEWQAADVVAEVCKKLGAKQLISLEGVGSPPGVEPQGRTFYYTTNPKMEPLLKKAGMGPLGEGIIIGVTAAALLKVKVPMSCIFAEVSGNLPDSKAAAAVIKVLDSLFGLNVDPKPLVKKAEEFEAKLRSLLEQAQTAQETVDKKQLSYVG